MTALVTGGSGFFGGLLLRRLLETGQACVNVDLIESPHTAPYLVNVKCDIRDSSSIACLARTYRCDAIYHCAAVLAHTGAEPRLLWTSNVDGTKAVADAAASMGAKMIFISSNCLWSTDQRRPVRESDAPNPVEIYGRSKLAAEQLLQGRSDLDVTILRVPTIIDEGRLGLLAILFEFVHEGRHVWMVGDGSNRYQFVYAMDLADACLAAARTPRADVFNVGSDDVPTLREMYQAVIDAAGTGARIATLPKRLSLAAMRLAHRLRLSPLGPYHYRMIGASFVFDTRHVRERLGWKPTLRNDEMLVRAYRYYHDHRPEIERRRGASAHRSPASMGVIKLLKWLS